LVGDRHPDTHANIARPSAADSYANTYLDTQPDTLHASTPDSYANTCPDIHADTLRLSVPNTYANRYPDTHADSLGTYAAAVSHGNPHIDSYANTYPDTLRALTIGTSSLDFLPRRANMVADFENRRKRPWSPH